MAEQSRGERAPRRPGTARAASAARRLLLTGGLAVAAWALGSAAPAFADTLGTVTDTANSVVESAVGGPDGDSDPRDGGSGSSNAESELATVAETAEAVVDPVRSAAESAPVPRAEQSVLDLSGLTGPAEDAPPSAVDSPAGDAPADRDRTVAEPDRAPAPEPEPAAPAEPAEKSHDGGPADQPSADHTESASQTGGSARHPSDGAPAPTAPAPSGSAQGQQGSSPSAGAFVGSLTHVLTAPHHDALTAPFASAPPFVARLLADDPSFSPD